MLCANMIFMQALGTSTMIIAAKNRTNLAGTAFVITLFTTLASIAAYFVDGILNIEYEYFLLLCYVAVIAVIYILSLIMTALINKRLFAKIKIYIHISAYNCAVMGSVYVVHNEAMKVGHFGLFDYFIFGIQSGLGFVLAAFILMAAYGTLNSRKVPRSFRGLPAMLIYIGVISMAIYSLT